MTRDISAEELTASSDGEFESIRLTTPVDQLADAWSDLRSLWRKLGAGGEAEVRYNIAAPTSMHGVDVVNLLRLAGFALETQLPAGRGGIIHARRLARSAEPLSCSIIVPCRNEVGNVDGVVRRTSTLAMSTEVIFVDGSSSDGTAQRIEELIEANPHRSIRLLRQAAGRGKADAVFQGFDAADGDVLIILDADMTVAPEDLPRFYLALAEGAADFANGTRFLYPMEGGAMPPVNAVGNRMFGAGFSWLLNTRISDTLCGTKALLKCDWPAISATRPRFGFHDVWGDFDLLLGAAVCRRRIVEVPVRYAARQVGESKMKPFRHGVGLSLTCMRGAAALKLGQRA